MLPLALSSEPTTLQTESLTSTQLSVPTSGHTNISLHCTKESTLCMFVRVRGEAGFTGASFYDPSSTATSPLSTTAGSEGVKIFRSKRTLLLKLIATQESTVNITLNCLPYLSDDDVVTGTQLPASGPVTVYPGAGRSNVPYGTGYAYYCPSGGIAIVTSIKGTVRDDGTNALYLGDYMLPFTPGMRLSGTQALTDVISADCLYLHFAASSAIIQPDYAVTIECSSSVGRNVQPDMDTIPALQTESLTSTQLSVPTSGHTNISLHCTKDSTLCMFVRVRGEAGFTGASFYDPSSTATSPLSTTAGSEGVKIFRSKRTLLLKLIATQESTVDITLNCLPYFSDDDVVTGTQLPASGPVTVYPGAGRSNVPYGTGYAYYCPSGGIAIVTSIEGTVRDDGTNALYLGDYMLPFTPGMRLSGTQALTDVISADCLGLHFAASSAIIHPDYAVTIECSFERDALITVDAREEKVSGGDRNNSVLIIVVIAISCVLGIVLVAGFMYCLLARSSGRTPPPAVAAPHSGAGAGVVVPARDHSGDVVMGVPVQPLDTGTAPVHVAATYCSVQGEGYKRGDVEELN